MDRVESMEGKDLLCKLHKSMYGIKQATRRWNEKSDSLITENIWFQSSDAHTCLYVIYGRKCDFLVI